MDKEINIIGPTSCGQLTGVLNYGIKEIPLENIGIEDLKDVEISSPKNDDILTYQDGKWINQSSIILNSDDIYILDGGSAIE